MIKLTYFVDSYLLNKFQSISDWMQDTVGINNFTIAKLLRFIMVISFAFREVFAFIDGTNKTEFIVIASSVMIIVKMEILSRKAEQSIKNKHGLINPVVSEYATTRMLMQLVAFVAFGFFIKHLFYIVNPSVNIKELYNQWKELFWDVFGITILFVAYFSSCTPKPYKPSKSRKLIESINRRVEQSIEAVPQKHLFNNPVS